MGIVTLISAQEYLSTGYRPDCDYIEPDEQVFSKPPYICVEILSPDDTFPGLQDRFDDYLAMGVANVWAIDPASRRAWRITAEGYFEALDQSLHTEDGRVALPLADLFTL